MNCPHCQSLNPEDVDYCIQCGKKLNDDDQARRILRFKWYFVAVVIFCLVMMLYLPR